jgi:hypothetical protein
MRCRFLGSASTATGKLPAVVLPAGTASELLDEIVRLRAENAALTSSSSWRITAPLRAIVSYLGRF